MRKVLMSICLFLGVSAAAVSAATVSGTVISSADSTPIAGATVVIREAGTGGFSDTAVTDSLGNYSLTGLAAGNYSLSVTMTNYRPYLGQVQVPMANSNVIHNVSLIPTAVPVFGPVPAQTYSFRRLPDGGLLLRHPSSERGGWIRGYRPSGAQLFSLALPPGSMEAAVPGPVARESILLLSLDNRRIILSPVP